MNLLVNAAQSFDERPREGNKILVSTSVEGGSVRVSVQDNGVGIADVSRIFEPFFTTKRGGPAPAWACPSPRTSHCAIKAESKCRASSSEAAPSFYAYLWNRASR